MEEREINSTFQFLGKCYKVVRDPENSCRNCAFYQSRGICEEYRETIGHCSNTTREDSNSVIFEEIDPGHNKRNFLLFY